MITLQYLFSQSLVLLLLPIAGYVILALAIASVTKDR